jgi:four helix bundle protein
MKKEIKFDLQDRLIGYAVRIIKVTDAFPNSATGNHIRFQMLKSGTSPAANYGEAQSAESRADFIHKLKIALKELRETEIWLKISFRSELIQSPEKLKPLLDETDEIEYSRMK